jgi:Tat protein translocase TatB subunit
VSLGPTEILVVLVVALLVLGPDKLPSAARQMGKFYRELRSLTSSVKTQVEDALEIDTDGPRRPKAPDGDVTPPPPGADPSEPEQYGPNPNNPDLTGFRFVDDEGPRHMRPAPDDPPRPDPDAPDPVAPDPVPEHKTDPT